ncbi:hypothetical protein R3I93_016058 [Phoxinus phoxinus]|uniref:Uncharacterized protein n=1 Tax=Phoxinus phoxinus TaxID=58324 RepID=A0AAN9CIT7_9TELE
MIQILTALVTLQSTDISGSLIVKGNGEGSWSHTDADVDRQSGNHEPSHQTAGGEIYSSPSQCFQLDPSLRLNIGTFSLLKIHLYPPD